MEFLLYAPQSVVIMHFLNWVPDTLGIAESCQLLLTLRESLSTQLISIYDETLKDEPSFKLDGFNESQEKLAFYICPSKKKTLNLNEIS